MKRNTNSSSPTQYSPSTQSSQSRETLEAAESSWKSSQAYNNVNDPDSSDSDFEDSSARLEMTKAEGMVTEFFKKWEKEYEKQIIKDIDNINTSKTKEINAIKFDPGKAKYRREIIHYFYNSHDSLHRNLDFIEELNKVTNEQAAPAEISDKFLIAQFRGIHYNKKTWNDREKRRGHYKDTKSPIGKPIFSEAVYAATNRSYCDQVEEANEKEMLQEADSLKELLLKMREEKNIEVSFQNQYRETLGKLKYAHKADAMSNVFSARYSLSKKSMRDGKFGDEIKNKFKAAVPYVATGDVPYHALKYAYGIKPYSQEEYATSMHLPDSEGRIGDDSCFRSGLHVGKISLSLHPLSDFNEEKGAVSTTEKVNDGKFSLPANILAEQETSFFAYLPEKRVVKEFIAKYPAFKGGYNDRYFYKYGLSELLFNKFKEILFVEDKNKRDCAKRLLGDYLCCYQEIKLICEALIESHERGKILIFKDGKHKFSLYPIVQLQIPSKGSPIEFRYVKSIKLNSLYEGLAESQNPPETIDSFLQDNEYNDFDYSILDEIIHQIVPSSELQLDGLNYQKILENGHCLFNAVALYVGQTQEGLRQMVADRLEHNLDDFRDFLQPPEGKSIEDYINDVRNGIEWASHVEIEVLMRLLDRPIMVVGPDGKLRNAGDARRFKGKPIFVYYNGHNHYNALLLTGEKSARAILIDLVLSRNQVLEVPKINELQVMNKKLEEQVKALEGIIERKIGVTGFTSKVIKTQAVIRGFFGRKLLKKEKEEIVNQGWQILDELTKKRKSKEIIELAGALDKADVLELKRAIKRFKGGQDDNSYCGMKPL